MKNKKILFVFSMVCLLFLLCSVNVFAGSGGGGGAESSREYDITTYKQAIFGSVYDPNQYIGEDVVCSAGTSSQNVSSAGDMNGNLNVCNQTLDPTINRYPAWMILFDPQFSSANYNASTGFSNNAFIFTSDKASEVEHARWRNLNNTTVVDGMNDMTGFNKGTANTSIGYQIVYLHRMTNGFDLYRNYRQEILYDDAGDYANPNSYSYYLSKNNGAFVASNSVMYYTVVPHVLGSEGTYYYSQHSDKNVQAHSLIAIMDEKNGVPVPVIMYKDADELTGFANIYYDDPTPIETAFPYGGPGEEYAARYTSLNQIKREFLAASKIEGAPITIRYNAYEVYVKNENGKMEAITIDTKAGLHNVIMAMKGPQYVGSVSLALDEALTQRYSAYAFMMSAGETGGTQQVATAYINFTTNIWPEKHTGAYCLTPRPSYYFFNGSTTGPDSSGIIQIDMLGNNNGAKDWEAGDAAFLASRTGNLNVNFKHSFTTYARGRCFNDYGDGCSFRHKYNYFNDVSIEKIYFGKDDSDPNNIVDIYYWSYVLVPKRANYVNDNRHMNGNYWNYGTQEAPINFVANGYELEANNGYTTFYYSDTNNNGTHQDDRGNRGSFSSSINSSYLKGFDENSSWTGWSDGQVYSDANNAWGVWRQSGYSANGVAFGGQFAKDTGPYPSSAFANGNLAGDDDGLDLYYDVSRKHVSKDQNGNTTTSYQNVCRFPFYKGANRGHGLYSELNINFLDSYKNIYINNGKTGLSVGTKGEPIHSSFGSLTDTFYQAVRTQPEWIFAMFRLSPTIISNKYDLGTSCNQIQGAYSEYFVPNWVNDDDLQTIYNEAANAICKNFGTTCNASNIHTALSLSGGMNETESVLSSTEGKFLNAYHAIMDALGQTSANSRGLTYGEHLANIWYNYYTLVNIPDEYAVGQLFACRGWQGGFYGYYAILQSDKSNIAVLNDETRFGHGATGNPLGTNLQTVTYDNLGNFYGPSLFLINSKGDLYVPEMDESEMKCPSGYTKDGDKCFKIHKSAYNTTCKTGYSFDFNVFKCVENSQGTTHCPEGYDWLNKKCLSQTGTLPICPDGQWNPESQVCENKKDPTCPSGYELKDVNYDNKIVSVNNYTFATGNGDLGRFTISGGTNLKQEDANSISYEISNSNAYIQISGLNLSTDNIKMIQLNVKNVSDGDLGRIAYVTNTATTYTNDKEVTFPMYVNNERGYATYTIDVSGGRWTDTVTGLRFYLGGASSGKIIIDSITFGSMKEDYKKELKCISEELPQCPTGFTMKDGRCYGTADSLGNNIPDGYELTCDHIIPGAGEKVTLVNFKVGDVLNIVGDQEEKTFVAPITGQYYIEAWGASNGTSMGGYTAGLISLNEGDTLHIRNGQQNKNTITAVAKNGKEQSDLIITAMSGGKGTNNASSYKVTKAGTEWFKKTTETTNTTWSGEKGHNGNGQVRITFYSYRGATASAVNKTYTGTGGTTAYNREFDYTGYEQSVTLQPGTYTFEVWGAQGGSLTSSGDYPAGTIPSNVTGAGKLGGYAKGTITINSAATYYIYVGGIGGSQYDQIDSYTSRNNNGGYNGGGSGAGQAGPGGGGATHITTVAGQVIANNVSSYKSSSSSNLMLIAGGGGGGNGCTAASTWSYMNGNNASTGWSGDYELDNGGGGAGYSGGNANSSDDGKCGYNGTSYVSTSMTATSTSANSRSGNGLAKITGTVKVDTPTSGTSLGYYISAPTTNATVAACYVSPSNETIASTNAFGNYLNSYQIPKCSVRDTIANGAGTSWDEGIFNPNSGTGSGGTTTPTPSGDPVGTVYPFTYTGSRQQVTLDPGVYKLETWGAQGGTSTAAGGKGGYSTGTITLTTRTTLYVYVGGQGGSFSSAQSSGGFNGGGGAGYGSSGYTLGTGGGASDIRVGTDSLYARVIVAGGGGGGGGDSGNSGAKGGAGGGSSGINGIHTNGNVGSSSQSSTAGGSGGTQSSAGYGSTRSSNTTGSFGVGGWGYPVSSSSGGGGGGWYGGGGGDCAGGGGGSGYVLTSSSTKPSGYLLGSQYYLTSASTKAGNTSFTSPTGTTETGHSGNGYVKITKTGDVGGSTGGTATVGTPMNFTYNGSVQQVTLTPGTYIVEAWGAQGGNASSAAYQGGTGGKGGYTKGTLVVDNTTVYYVIVGGQGESYNATYGIKYGGAGGFGGAGGGGQPWMSGNVSGGAGGGGLSGLFGSTNYSSSAILIAGGGGGGGGSASSSGTDHYMGSNGGYGGGSTAGNGVYNLSGSTAITHKNSSYVGKGGTQSSGGAAVSSSAGESSAAGGKLYGGGGSGHNRGNSGNATSLAGGAGMTTSNSSSSAGGAGGGGGGWFGGSGGGQYGQGGGGGSSYVNTSMLTSTQMTAGNQSFTSPTGTTETGHSGNGYVRITPLSITSTGGSTSGGNYNRTFQYTGGRQETTLEPGTYTFKVWGAQGGYRNSSTYGGMGGYSEGTITLTERTTIYVYVGGSGNTGGTSGGFNGGGKRNSYPGGGGASDIRIGTDSLYARVIVAGGGGSDGATSKQGMYGGGASGGSTTQNYGTGGYGGTQSGNTWLTTGSQSSTTSSSSSTHANAGFGFGGNGLYYADGYGGAGGGGWYGGSGVVPDGSGDDDRGGGGGSGYVLTSSSTKPSGYLLGSQYYLTNTKMLAGNETMPSISGGSTQVGNSGNGYVIITGTIANTFENDFTPIVKDRCISEAQYKILPTCDNVANSTYNPAKEVCEKQNDVSCVGGIYNEEVAKCEYKIAPTGCNNGGILEGNLTNGYACYRVATPTCDDGYHLENGVCTKDNIDEYENQLCPSGFTFDKPNRVCTRRVEVPLQSVNIKPLEEEMNVVEINKMYKFTNYVGYRASAAKANGEVTENVPFTSTSVFPAINITFTLMQSGDTEIKSSDYCREHKNDSGCQPISSDIQRYEIKLEDIVKQYGEQYAPNKYNEIFIGDKEGNQFHSANPEIGNNLVVGSNPGTNKDASEYLWSQWNGGNMMSMTDGQFTYLWSSIDVYFMFKENEFCFLNKPAGEELVDKESFACMPYVEKEGFTVIQDFDGDGTEEVVLDMEKDENGKTKTNTIHIMTQVTNPNDYVDGDYTSLYVNNNNQKDIGRLLMDNNYFTDDISDFVTAFKLAPDGDVYIDRFEVVRADTGEVVFAADAMTKDRCKNGYKPEAGESVYTQTYASEPYDYGERVDPIDCLPFNPQDATTVLETTVNYYVRTYTKYIAFNEQDIEEEKPAAMNYIAIDIMHLSNDDGENAFGEYIGSMLNSSVGEEYTIRDGLVDSSGANVDVNDIIHNEVINVCPVNGLFESAPVDKKVTASASDNEAINEFFRKDNDFDTSSVNEPLSVLIIPAEGLFAKGKTNGYYQMMVSGEIGNINAYPSWDIFDFRYYLGEGPDIETTLVLKCAGGDYTEKTNACVLVPQGESGCKLYAVVKNVGNIEHTITTNVRVDVANKSGIVSWENGSLYSNPEETNFIDEGNLEREIFIQDVTENIYASANHGSSDNDDYADKDWSNNVDENCFLFNYTNYSIKDLNYEVNGEETRIFVETDCEFNPLEPTLNLVFDGTYKVVRDFDNQATRNVPIEYEMIDKNGNVYGAECSFTPVSTTVANGGETEVAFTGSCTINITKNDIENFIGLRVKINGGKEGTHSFEESEYEDNEVLKTLSIGAIPKNQEDPTKPCSYQCDDTCVEQNKWTINFDFLYTFDRNIKNYQTNYQANMQWTDYDVGNVSGSTEDKEYSSPIGVGNVYRAPDDYLAFTSSYKTYTDLCTDYRNENAECWRYEQNTVHHVTYYLWSRATTSVYTTHAVMSSGNSYCQAEQSTFNGETYGNQDNGASGSSHNFAEVTGGDRQKESCHGWSGAPSSEACLTTMDWWDNALCKEYREINAETADTGKKPGDYIPYAYFQDYTIRDGFPMSPTTSTDQIILSSQVAHTNDNQGSAHPGWVEEKTMDVCTTMAPRTVYYKCPSTYTFGTDDGLEYSETWTDGYGKCEQAGLGVSTRYCTWENDSISPSTSTWYDTDNGTCYRQHRDYVCGSYYDYSNDNYTYENSSGNGTSGTCSWTEVVDSYYEYHDYREDYAYDEAECESTCTAYYQEYDEELGKYVDTDRCRTYTSGTCVAEDTDGCAYCRETCSYGNGVGCSVECEDYATYYYGEAWYESSDGIQTDYDSYGQCDYSSSFGSVTFTYSDSYNGYTDNGEIEGNIAYSCSGGDYDSGKYCYETTSGSRYTSTSRCIRWDTRTYKEIKYYSTATPTSSEWVSRTHDGLSNIWQYTCDTKTPTVPYPTDTTFKMNYEEKITSVTQIKTVRSNGAWVNLNNSGTIDQNIAPRRGEWFELRFVLTYSTTRGQKPNTMPTLQAYYNNYHNIATGDNNNTTYPDGGYNHYGVINSNHTAFGDGNTVQPSKFADIVNNHDYGYCDARPAEPYGCAYNSSPSNQFDLSVDASGNKTQNNHVETQGHQNAAWISNQEGNGVCFYGPDNRTVWKKSEFGNDYVNTAMICTDANGGKCNEETAMANYTLSETSSQCTRWSDAKKNLCIEWVKIFEIPVKNVDGEAKKGMFLPGDFDASKRITIDMRTSHFNAVGQYEKELLGLNTLSSGGSEQFFIEQVGNPIKQLCRCQTTSFSVKPENYGWGSSEWEVE